MLTKSEIFSLTLSIVSEVTEIPRDDILSKNSKEEVVDARYLLVNYLHLQGLYPSQIAAMVNRTPRQIRTLIDKFYTRMSRNDGILESYRICILQKLRSASEVKGK